MNKSSQQKRLNDSKNQGTRCPRSLGIDNTKSSMYIKSKSMLEKTHHKSTFLDTNDFSTLRSPPIMSAKDQTSYGRSLLLAVEPPEKKYPLTSPPNSPSTNRAPPRRVDHTYRDVSQFSFDKPHSNKTASANFPDKLHKILSTPKFSHVSHDAMHFSQLLNSI